MMRNLLYFPRTSVMAYKRTAKPVRQIGSELGAGSLLEGSVRRDTARLRIVAQLIDARSDEHLWSETYDRPAEDVFAVQSDIARRIASALQTTLTPQEQARIESKPTENLEAYELYLKARFAWNRRTAGEVQRALDLLREALELDPEFALAHAALADAYVILGVYGTRAPESVFPTARAAALRALEIDAGLAEPHAALGCTRATYQGSTVRRMAASAGGHGSSPASPR